jgi:hypothetical protein
MIICPNCQHKEINGAIYCSKCGAQLVDARFSTHKINTAETFKEVEPSKERIQPPLSMPLQSWISLHLIESGQILPLADRTEFTLGRSAEGQPIVPDVDLSSYNAYANGSRFRLLQWYLFEWCPLVTLYRDACYAWRSHLSGQA